MDEFLIGNSIPELRKVSVQHWSPLIGGAVYATYRKGKEDFDLFLKECRRSVKLWNARPLQQYEIWIHLDISSPPAWLTSSSIMGIAFDVVSRNHLTRHLSSDDIEEARLLNKIDFSSTRWFFHTHISARDSDEAFDRATQSFELLRSILNWAFHSHVLRGSFGRTKEASIHYPPRIYAERAESEKPNLYPGYGVIKSANSAIQERDEGRAKEWLGVFKTELRPKTIKGRIAESMVLAAEGLDSIYPSHQCLAIWTALERLSLVESGSPSEVAKRIPRIWQNGADVDLALALKQLAQQRNRLVHEGQFEHDNEAALMWLRLIFANVLLRLMDMQKRIRHLDSLNEVLTGQTRTLTAVRARIAGQEELLRILKR